ncbi:MAG: SDR family NAD(P)-dependent oxidoreductase [Pricia sp.]
MKKTILITGSTDGIGKGAALKLAKDGHRVYMHGRNADKLANVVQAVQEESQNEEVHGFIADFSDLSAVRKMAGQVQENVGELDVLINNAGVYKSATQQNKDGLDMRIVVNYLASYVLTNELIPLLQKSVEPRLINLSSGAQSPVSLEALQGKERQSESQTYAQSKLALTMWSFHLAKKHPGIAVIAVNPGSLLNTKMVEEAFGNHWSPADKGANILYDLAASEEYQDISGKYFDNDKGAFGKAHQDAYEGDKIDRLVEVTDEIVSNIKL